MADLASSGVRAPSPVIPGAGRSAGLPHDPACATELLYRRHGATVFRYARHLLGRREDAEDASQATFLAVHRALGAGTAVLEPGAWVLRIARNECLGRLRQRTPPPEADSLEGLVAPPAGGTERLAEVRDQMRVARHTLRTLPVNEREAFVLREWLGLQTAEVALAMSLTPIEIESLAGRARRSLVLAVGGLEPALGCAGTRAALQAGSLGRAGTVHLLRCPICRGVRRALRPPLDEASERAPIAVVGQRLAGALPGFASGGGGIVAVLTTKAAAAPLLAKTAAIVVAALATAGVARQEIQHAASSRPVAAGAHARGGEARVLAVAPVARAKVIARAPVARAPKAAATTTVRPRVQLVALAVPTVSHVRGGAASTVGAGAPQTSRAASSGARDSGHGDQSGEGGGSAGNVDREHDHSRSGDKPSGGSESETPAAKTTTTTSGNEDRPSTSRHGDANRSSKDGSGNDGGANSDGSGKDGSARVNDRPELTPAVVADRGEDGGAKGGDGSADSGSSRGDGSSSNGDGGGESAAPATETAPAPAVVPAAAVVPAPAVVPAAPVTPAVTQPVGDG